MHRVILFRHAKAALAASEQRDFDRPLTGRGRRDAELMGRALTGLGLDLALVSAALRTRETWEIASTALGAPLPHAEIDKDLYLSGARKLIRRLGELPESISNTVVVGHNPDMHEVAIWLAGEAEGKTARELREKFPTAAIAIFTLDCPWDGIAPNHAKLERILIPAELRE